MLIYNVIDTNYLQISIGKVEYFSLEEREICVRFASRIKNPG
jgi:hypothetical protein